MAVDAWRLPGILVADDGDFIPPVRSVQNRGLKVRVVFWKHGTSRELREAADEFLELDPYFDQLTRLADRQTPSCPSPPDRPAGTCRSGSSGQPTPTPGDGHKPGRISRQELQEAGE
jgi:hypothetical protein